MCSSDLEPAGWVAIEPRENYPRIWARQKSWMRRDPELDGVWSVTCFVVRTGFRRQGLMYELAAAAVDHARRSGAGVLEGYPTEPVPGKTVIWDEASVGLLQVFLDAGFEVVASPTLRRRVVRHRLDAPAPEKTVIWDEASVGLLQVFLDAGYEVVESPTLRRRVVRFQLT